MSALLYFLIGLCSLSYAQADHEEGNTTRPMDCYEILLSGHHRGNGVYAIWPRSRVIPHGPVNVMCNMDYEGGGWTIIQRRGDFGRPEDYFNRDWADYKNGFGNIRQDFWIGNDLLYALTNQRVNQLRVLMSDWEGNITYANYQNFWIDHELHNYTLHVQNYFGDAGDSFTYHDGSQFSTKGRSSCADWFSGAWWYKFCHLSNLNGLYKKGHHESFANGVNWYTFRGYNYALKDVYMGIRPSLFNP